MEKIDETTEFKPRFNEAGLIPAIAQSATGDVLMMAWMNQEALTQSLETGEAHYWSRSRQELWHKGATSGSIQKILSIFVDCDQDVLLLKVEEQGSACHTGRANCFYRALPLAQNSDKNASPDNSFQQIQLIFTDSP